MFFTNSSGTVVGVGDTVVKVAKGATERWTISAQIADASNLNSVLRGVG